ncbi:WD40-repeat-containing domain protein [Pisolithus marmoratus]|nr:WD40-repeat-containing domain protein [Pisolithus marmoratus]
MLLDVSRKLCSRSDRVKGTDFHPTEPWLLTGLYNGTTFEVSTVPVRCVRFIARKNWFVAGSDDFQLRVFNYNTHEKVTSFEAHPDYIRCLAVHPSASIVLTGSDDMTIKAWDWDKQWKCIQVYEGHSHYVMNIAFNPKDANTFASACLDRTVKMWSLGSPHPNFTMDAHDKGVNYVDFYPGPDRPYIVTTGDDKTIKVWDYLSKSCVQTMEGHINNPSFAVFHPNLPIIISGSEDGTVKFWNSNTYRLENTLSYALERAWCVALRRDANEVAVGYDEGIVVIKCLAGTNQRTAWIPSGKLIYTRNQLVLSGNIQTLSSDDPLPEGTRIPLSIKELGTTEIFANALFTQPQWSIPLAWRNKSFGAGTSFAWAGDSNTYAVLENKVKLRLYKNFKERGGVGMKGSGSWSLDAIFGGPVLGARGKGFVVFWDWETGEVVRRIDVEAKSIYWSGTGSFVVIASEDSFYVLRFDRDAYNAQVEQGVEITDEGVEEAFDVVAEISDSVKTAKWVGDCFIYTTGSNRINYFVGTESYTISPSDVPLYILGYVPAHNRVYLADKDMNYQTAILPSIPKEQLNKVARFLEARGMNWHFKYPTDPDHRFDLALQLDDLDVATDITRSVPEAEAESKWKALGDRALAVWRFDLAKEAFEKAGDLSSLMLLLLAVGNRDGLRKVGSLAEQKGANNLAFATFFQLGDTQACVDLLVKTNRAPEAALFARTYAPSQWRTELRTKNKPKIAASISHPSEHAELFEEGWQDVLSREVESR